MKSMRWMVLLAVAASLLAVQAAAQKPADDLLKKLGEQVQAAPGLADNVKAFVKAKLLPLCRNEVFVKETKALNDKKVTLDEIKKIDEEWQKAEAPLPIQNEKKSNDCAKEVKKLADANKAIAEAFVMDNQGAVVGENNLTSDYWQGDEPKWANSFNGGKGGVDVGKVSLDKSTNISLQQVSLPIIDASGAVIGAVTWGIDLSKL